MKDFFSTLCAYALFVFILTPFVLLAAPFYLLFGVALYGSWVVFGIVLFFSWLLRLGAKFAGREKTSSAPVPVPISLETTGAKSG